MKREFIMSALIVLTMFTGLMSCSSQTASDQANTASDGITVNDKDVVSVYYFHGERRCTTCKAVGKVSKKTIEENFADNPNVGTGRILDKIGDPLGKVPVLARMGNRTVRSIGMIETHDDPKPLVGQILVVATALSAGVGPDFLGDQDPTFGLVIDHHQVFATPIMHAVEVGGFTIRNARRLSHGYTP